MCEVLPSRTEFALYVFVCEHECPHHNTRGLDSKGGGSESSWIVEAKSQRVPFEEVSR